MQAKPAAAANIRIEILLVATASVPGAVNGR
jgi:hypothetical protein